jgi:hypothetical membrane protein
VGILNIIFSWLPIVTTLPTVNGYDIDGALLSGMGQLNLFMITFWPMQIMFNGFIIIMGYYGIKMTLRLFFGSRAPAH